MKQKNFRNDIDKLEDTKEEWLLCQQCGKKSLVRSSQVLGDEEETVSYRCLHCGYRDIRTVYNR